MFYPLYDVVFIIEGGRVTRAMLNSDPSKISRLYFAQAYKDKTAGIFTRRHNRLRLCFRRATAKQKQKILITPDVQDKKK